MPEEKKTRKRSWVLDRYVLEALKYRDGITSLRKIEQGTGLKRGTLSKAFNRKPVQSKTIKKIAAFFRVDPEALKTGVISPLDAGETVNKAYRLLAKEFMPGGEFANFPRERDCLRAAKDWNNPEFQEMNLKPDEYGRLFALLNGRYVTRTKDNRYERLERGKRDCFVYAKVLGKATHAVADSPGEIRHATTQFNWMHKRIHSSDDVRDTLGGHQGVLTSFVVRHPHIHAWLEECWEVIRYSFETIEPSRLLHDGMQELTNRIDGLCATMRTCYKDQERDVLECLNGYFGALTGVVSRCVLSS